MQNKLNSITSTRMTSLRQICKWLRNKFTKLKMVRVLMCYNFKDQKVFSDAYQPTAITFSASLNFVFISTSDSRVIVYSLCEEGFPLVCQLPLIFPAKELLYNDIGAYILTKETPRKDKPGHCVARVYYNWSKWDKMKTRKLRQHHLGFSLSRSSTTGPTFDHNAVNTLEISSRFSVRALACCPATGNIAVATETTVSVYKSCASCVFDLEKVYSIESGFSICKLDLYEQFVTFASAVELRVLKIGSGLGTASDIESSNIDVLNLETEKFLASGALSNSVIQREVFDEQFVVWSFNQQATDSKRHNFWEDVLASREWASENNDDQRFDESPTVIELPSVKKEAPYIDYGNRSCEVLGPVKAVHGHPITVWGPARSSSDLSDTTMLYRHFGGGEAGKGDELAEIHTLQLVPFYTNDCSLNQLPKLSGMFCFVSSTNKGIIYKVFSKTEIISECNYTSATKTASIQGNILYTVTSHGIETYSVPFYSVVAKEMTVKVPADSTIIEAPFSDSEIELDIAVEVDSETGGGDGNDGVTEKFQPTQDDMPKTGNRTPKLEIDHSYPVYDVDILRKPCPALCKDLCMVGVHHFKGVHIIVTTGKRILLLSNDTTSSSRRLRRKSKSVNTEGPTKDWTLHVLQAMDLSELYLKMERLTEKSDDFNTQADLRLLKEQHLILRCQATVEHLSSATNRDEFLNAFRSSVKNIGDYYARYAVDEFEDVLLYYAMAEVSLDDVVHESMDEIVDIEKLKDRKFGKGLLCYLNDVFFHKNHEKNCIVLSKTIADKVIYMYSNGEPGSLSMLILRQLIGGYCPELAAKLLVKLKKTKGYSFTVQDHLALVVVYLQLCAVEHAAGELLNLPKDNLAEVCVKRRFILFEKDESLTPVAQLIRRRLPKVFIKTLVSLHLRGIMTLKNALQILEIKSLEVHRNTHLLEFLELVLNDQKGKQSFKEARELAVDIYFKQLSDQTAPARREPLRSPHSHVLRGTGHFSKRYPWLDKLPPFEGSPGEPKDCPYVKKTNNNSQLPVPSPQSGAQSDGPGARKPCKCCCCWESLLKIQSLLCSRHRDEDLGNFVLNKLLKSQSVIDISISLLCLPLIREYEKAIELLLETQSSLILTYGKQYFGNTPAKWNCVLGVLMRRIRERENVDDEKYDEYKEILKETLLILSQTTTPSEMLSLLPDDGNFAFFLPFLVESCNKTIARELSNEIIAR